MIGQHRTKLDEMRRIMRQRQLLGSAFGQFLQKTSFTK